MATHYAERMLLIEFSLKGKGYVSKVPTILVNTCETQVQNLATRLDNYSKTKRLLQLNLKYFSLIKFINYL